MFGLDKKDEPKADDTLDSQNGSTMVTPVDDNTVNVTVNPVGISPQTTPSVNDQGTVSMPEPEITLPDVADDEEPTQEATIPEDSTALPTPSTPEITTSAPEAPVIAEGEEDHKEDNLPEGADFQEVEEDKPEVESTSSVPAPSVGNTDLQDLKATTLKDLAPIIGHLDLEPSEKLKTIMELYESTKDQSLLKEAHEAAIALPDDTARAKALLELVHKIDELV